MLLLSALLQNRALPQVSNIAQHLPLLTQDLGARKCRQCMLEVRLACPMAGLAQLPRITMSSPASIPKAGEASLHCCCMSSAPMSPA